MDFINKPDDLAEKNEDWYLNYARYVAAKYNHIIPQFYPRVVDNDTIQRPDRWASMVMRAYSYVFAEQINGLYDYMAMDENNNPYPIKLVNSHIIQMLIKHMQGTMQDMINTLPDTVYAKCLDNEFLSYKKNLINLAKLKHEFKFVFEDLVHSGMEFDPIGGKDYETTEELEETMETTVQHDMEKYFTAWCADWLYKTDYMSWVKQCLRYLVPAYFNRVELYTEDWDIKIKVHKPQNCIWDNGYDDEFGTKRRLLGVIEEYTIPQLKAAYPDLKKEQLEALQAKAKEYQNAVFNTADSVGLQTGGIIWFSNASNVPVVTVAKTYWVSIGEDGLTTWYRTDLIGNEYPKNMGLVDNLIVDNYDNLIPPFFDYIPELINGKNKGPVEMAMDIVDRLKGIRAKSDLLINRIKGNIITLFADKFPNGADHLSILQDIANGLLTLEGVDIDDLNPNQNRGNQLFDVKNIGVDIDSYRALSEERIRLESEIKEIFSIPTVALGQQQNVIGKGVQEQTIIASSYGVKPFNDGFAQYINNIVGGACEMRKNLILLSDGSDEQLETLQLTPRQYQIFKVSKDWSLSKLNIYLDSKDIISEQQRAEYRMIFEREAQNPQSFVDAEVVADAIACKTNTQLRALLKYKKKVFEDKQQQARREQEALAAQQAANANQTQENIATIQNQGKLANTAMKVEGDLEKEALKQDGEMGA